ncbi:aryl-alcohol dehydrogenase protein [Rutstroemia sp. NJR-2017a WRK4]|nr:aryl-alcohol dehydrogenase protein [Rutstroemia sp. NJR-2017a WRK4]
MFKYYLNNQKLVGQLPRDLASVLGGEEHLSSWLIVNLCKASYLPEPTDPPIIQHDAYGIVIIGAVLLLEAGEDRNQDEKVEIPALFGLLMGDPEFDWKYLLEAQANLHDYGPSYSSAYVPLNAHEPVQPPSTELLKKGITEFYDDFPSAEIQCRFIQRMIESPTEATATHFLARRQFYLEKSDPREIFAPTDPANYISTLAILSHPISRGHLHIKSANPQEPPMIDFKYMSHPLDGEIYGRHMMFHDDLVRTEPLASLLKPNGKDSTTLENAIELIKSSTMTNYHPWGTWSMMSEDLGGVVNSRPRVYGTRNVRVVDASMIPIIPRGNIITNVYALAEKAADMIKEDLVTK